jgi:hypothetical protein
MDEAYQVGRVRAGSASCSAYTSTMASVSSMCTRGVCSGVGASGIGVLGLTWVGDLVDDFLDFFHVD